MVKAVEDLKLQLGQGGVGVGPSGDQQKVGSTAPISPSHTHPTAAAPSSGPPRHPVPFGEDDEQVISVLSLYKRHSSSLSISSLLLLLLSACLLVRGVRLLWL